MNGLDSLFLFLEKSPYFYKKEEEFFKKFGGDRNRIVYKFFDEENPCHSFAEISIPLEQPNKDVDWKFVQLNIGLNKNVTQIDNNHLYYTPKWFKTLVSEVKNIYSNIISLFKVFD